jgi:molybdopterin molybdotransferase
MAAREAQGLANRAGVQDAVHWIDVHVAPLGREDACIADAAGRVLCEDVPAELDLPPFDRAAVDGLAVRADETVGAGAYNPLLFRLAPGAGDAGDLPPGSAVRLDAGDRLPRGADAIVPLDHVGSDETGAFAVIEPVIAGNEVERAGSQGARGSTLVRAWRRLDPAEIGVLAAAGRARIGVVRRPRVRCVTRGDTIEAGSLQPPAAAVGGTDAPMLRGLVERDGGSLAEGRRFECDREPLLDALEAPGADIVLLVGSAGRGFDGRTAAVLAEAGELAIDGVALRPGAATRIGRTRLGVPVFLLPGAPVACLWAYEFFAGRAIRRLGGRSPAFPFPSRQMTATRKVVSEIGMTEVVPVRRTNEDGVEPMASFAAAGLRAVTEADGFVVVPEGSEGYQKGSILTVYLYDGQVRAQS